MKNKKLLIRFVEKVERACICWRTNTRFMSAEDWRELESLVKEIKEEFFSFHSCK